MPDTRAEFVIPDWTASMVPPPVFAVAAVELGDTHVIVGIGEGGDALSRRLTPEQALQVADELRARALVISPEADDTREDGHA